MKKNITEIANLFGIREIPYALFYQYKYGLRFELGGEAKDTIPCFLQAMDRARVITCSIFPLTVYPVDVVFSNYGGAKSTRRNTAFLKDLEKAGFDTSSVHYIGKTAQNDDDHIKTFGKDLYRYWYYGRTLSEDDLNILLWCSLSTDLNITPKIWCDIYLVDIERKIILHAYDDRGMDIVALTPEVLLPLYVSHNKWLLDYDRERMDAVFKSE